MISAVVLTKNEEENILDCLSGLGWCDEIIVIDDNSEDKTVRVIRNFRAVGKKVIVLQKELNGDFAGQRNFGLAQAKGDWVLFVDADERVSDDLKKEIEGKIREKNEVKGFFLRRHDFFFSKWLRHGEIGGVRLLRLARKDAGVWQRKVDEIWQVKGRVETLATPLLHYSHPDLTQVLENINSRSSLNARVLFENGETLTFFDWLKPFLKFVDNYLVKLGLLDGVQGFIFAVLMSLHSFLVRGKVYLLISKNEGNTKQ